jgi:hypothetical protein
MSDTLTLNQANLITYVMVDTNGVEVAGLGTAPVVTVSKAGGAFSASAGTKAEISNGWYSYALTASECDTLGPLSIKVTHASTAQQNLVYFVGGANAGAVAFTYTLTSTAGATPIEGASVWVTTDSAGNNVIASGTTDAAGEVLFYVQAGTYYVWRQLAGFTFQNPDLETVA